MSEQKIVPPTNAQDSPHDDHYEEESIVKDLSLEAIIAINGILATRSILKIERNERIKVELQNDNDFVNNVGSIASSNTLNENTTTNAKQKKNIVSEVISNSLSLRKAKKQTYAYRAQSIFGSSGKGTSSSEKNRQHVSNAYDLITRKQSAHETNMRRLEISSATSLGHEELKRTSRQLKHASTMENSFKKRSESTKSQDRKITKREKIILKNEAKLSIYRQRIESSLAKKAKIEERRNDQTVPFETILNPRIVDSSESPLQVVEISGDMANHSSDSVKKISTENPHTNSTVESQVKNDHIIDSKTYTEFKTAIDIVSANIVAKDYAKSGATLSVSDKESVLIKARKTVANRLAEKELGLTKDDKKTPSFYAFRDSILRAYDSFQSPQAPESEGSSEATKTEPRQLTSEQLKNNEGTLAERLEAVKRLNEEQSAAEAVADNARRTALDM